jgi:uncharacterized tellurite resistance protein B-like protein
MLGPAVDISEDEGVAIARGLLTIARCDGTYDEREKELIKHLLPVDTEGLPDISPEELAGLISPDAGRVFLKSCFLVAFADQDYSRPERKLIEKYAERLEIPDEEVASIAQAVKEYLLAPLSRLSNVQAIAEVSKKISF